VLNTELLVFWPISLLAFSRAIIYLAASRAIKHFAAFHHPIRYAALRIETKAHLCDGLDFFVLLIQALTGDVLFQILD
jgi:hypothetical protein